MIITHIGRKSKRNGKKRYEQIVKFGGVGLYTDVSDFCKIQALNVTQKQKKAGDDIDGSPDGEYLVYSDGSSRCYRTSANKTAAWNAASQDGTS